MTVDVLVFDLGNVIVRVSHAAMAAALAARSSDPRFQDPERVLALAFDDRDGLTVEFDTGRLTADVFCRSVSDRLSLSLSFEEFAACWNAGFEEQVDVTALIRRLHGRYRLMLLSNTNELHYRHLQSRVPVLSLMERTFLSFELGMRKPDRAIYERVIRDAGVDPARIVYIDDIEAYTRAAAGLGIQAVTFESAAQLERALQARGLLG
ncbi:MAG TPA: HAD family phosphatase [Nitrospiria bacterium]|nr:HAD family phosphatase [Nitrospiria bacterium]